MLLVSNACRSRSVICVALFRHLRPAFSAFAVFVMLFGVAMNAMAWDVDRIRLSAYRQGAAQQESIRSLLKTVSVASRLDEVDRLNAVNLFFNRRVEFRDDIDVWGQVDYWATPLEMLGHGAGDCEDFAIAKYFSLVAAGINPARMRLVYVKATLTDDNGDEHQQAHMVLAYYAASGDIDPLILDNLTNEIESASSRPDLLPVFSFNTEGMWSGTQGSGAGDPVSRLSHWRDLLARARDQGFL
jgi:predicted transglutaminase-like cysteine proteinase